MEANKNTQLRVGQRAVNIDTGKVWRVDDLTGVHVAMVECDHGHVWPMKIEEFWKRYRLA